MNGRDVTGSKTLGKSSETPRESSGRRRKPLGKSSGILRKETGSQPLVAVPPSLGNPSENLRKSSGTPRKPRKPLGKSLGNPWKSLETPREIFGNRREMVGKSSGTPRKSSGILWKPLGKKPPKRVKWETVLSQPCGIEFVSPHYACIRTRRMRMSQKSRF